MNIMSALFRVVGKHRAVSRNDAWWLSISYATGARRVYRHTDSRFIYPPSSRHVHFGPMPLQNRQHREHMDAIGTQGLLRTR